MVIVAIMGRSGSGKSTLEKSFEDIGYTRIISYTTREIRSGEVNHREYHFISRENFQELINRGFFIEWAEYNGNLYGSPKPVGITRGVIVTELEGLKKLKEIYGDQILSVYIDTPIEEIERRLDLRNNTLDRESRKKADDIKFAGAEEEADLLVNGMNRPTDNLVIILHEITRRGIMR